MSYFLFIDESGQDRKASPYEVLAGLLVQDAVLWNFVQKIKKLQEKHFGLRLFDIYGAEAKGQKLLKAKVFKHAAQSGAVFSLKERRDLAHQALTDGTKITRAQLTALAQAKLAYVKDVMAVCLDLKIYALASIIPQSTLRPTGDFLRKDYTFLFERFFSFLERKESETKNPPMGIVVFDEIDKKASHLLIQQMDAYFTKTANGRKRAKKIVPEPLFVHSDLTTMIQIVDLVAYIISWAVRLKGGRFPMKEPVREELAAFAAQVLKFRLHLPAKEGEAHDVWGFKLIHQLTLSTKKGNKTNVLEPPEEDI